MGRPKSLTPQQEMELIEWWLKPRTVTAKAREMGIAVGTIYHVLERHRIGGRTPSTSKDVLVRRYLNENRGKRTADTSSEKQT